MKLNLNIRCQVKLTDSGIEKLERDYPPGYVYNFDPKTRVLTTELWHIMNIFGSMMYNGQPRIPFVKNEVEIYGND